MLKGGWEKNTLQRDGMTFIDSVNVNHGDGMDLFVEVSTSHVPNESLMDASYCSVPSKSLSKVVSITIFVSVYIAS